MGKLKAKLSGLPVGDTVSDILVLEEPNSGQGAEFIENFDDTSKFSDGDSYVNSTCRIDETHKTSSPHSVRITYQAGERNGGGFIKTITTLSEGDEIWTQFEARWDAGWLFNDSAGWKFLRHRVFTSTGSHIGYLDWYNASSRFGDSAWYFRNEVNGGTVDSFASKTTQNVDPGAFHKYEMYIKLSSSSSVGKVRCWRDNAPIYNATRSTLKNSSDELRQVYWSTFFNEDTQSPFKSYNPVTTAAVVNSNSETGSPQTQSWNVDDIIMRTSKGSIPNNIDSNGNRFIG